MRTPSTPTPRSVLRRLFVRALAAAVGLALALGTAELLVRALQPDELERTGQRFEVSAEQTVRHPRHGLYAVDEELGFVPRRGGPLADVHGCAPNEYSLEKPAGTTRVLFVGDSVTGRGAIVRGLRALWGEEGVEYWNAGFEGFNVHQTERYHARIGAALDADHVVFTFHPNDLSATPVVFLDGDRLVVHALKLSSTETNRWLFKRSHLYRLWLSRKLSEEAAASSLPLDEVEREAEAALVALRDRVEASGARFSVVLFPWIQAVERWPRLAREAREAILAITARHGIRAFDPLQTLVEALDEGPPEALRQTPKDMQHPSDAFGARLARNLVALGLTPEGR